MLNHSTLRESLWICGIKDFSILNRVPTKATSKTPYEHWTRKKPSLKNLNIWGCTAGPRPYRPNEKKLDFETTCCYFFGYSEMSMGFRFYDPTTKAIFETGNAICFEDVKFSEGNLAKEIAFE
nr:hypothetical protein M5689_013526 [Euphorbia peplus]